MNLIDNASKAWKMFSVQAMAFIAAISALASQWDSLPQGVKDAIPQGWMPYITGALAIAGIVGRLVSQPAVQSDKP